MSQRRPRPSLLWIAGVHAALIVERGARSAGRGARPSNGTAPPVAGGVTVGLSDGGQATVWDVNILVPGHDNPYWTVVEADSEWRELASRGGLVLVWAPRWDAGAGRLIEQTVGHEGALWERVTPRRLIGFDDARAGSGRLPVGGVRRAAG